MSRTTRRVDEEQLREAREIGEPFVREYQEGDFCELEGTYIRDRLNKLGHHEDIEEEFGIDLITLFKALKNGIYTVNHSHGGYEPIRVSLKIGGYGDLVTAYLIHPYDYDDGEYTYRLNDYGKTWALTKEELE